MFHPLLEKVTIPEAQHGDWAIEHFTISDREALAYNQRLALKTLFHGQEATKTITSRSVLPGSYTRLVYLPDDPDNRVIYMSDTHAERAEHSEFIDQAKGRVLITGLGLGLCVLACLKKPEVTCVHVVERSQEVIDLVGQHYLSSDLNKFGKLRIIKSNAFYGLNGHPGIDSQAKYDTIWHDIWPEISEELKTQAHALFEIYQPLLAEDGWQGAWALDQAEIMEEEEEETKQYTDIREAVLAYSNGQIDLATDIGKIMALALFEYTEGF